jgi:hypothetical protein
MEFAMEQPRRRDGIKEYELWDEMLLYFPEKEEAVSLNRSAKAIFKLCNGDHTIAEIAQILATQLGCSGDQLLVNELLSDIRVCVIELARSGLLELKGLPDAQPA